jgi:hypothetical protein
MGSFPGIKKTMYIKMPDFLILWEKICPGII